MKNQIEELFSAQSLGAMRVALFSKFYEDLLRQYFDGNLYEVLQGKPRIFWKHILIPQNGSSENHYKLINNLKKKQKNAQFCIPDGLFIQNNNYYVWEAKNWIQELYPSPLRKHIWEFPWLLAREVN